MSNKETHESYGMLQFCRSTGGCSPLFGTSVKHGDKIRMYLRHGAIERSLNNDWYTATGEIACVEMSYSQFAEAITSMNSGSGVPVTIKYLNGQKMDDCPYVDKRKQFENEFSDKLNTVNDDVNKLIDDITALFNEKKTLTLKDKTAIMTKLYTIQQNIGTNTAYVYEQFNEQMEKTIAEAKGEIELFFQNKIHAFASTGLVENNETNPVSLLESGD